MPDEKDLNTAYDNLWFQEDKPLPRPIYTPPPPIVKETVRVVEKPVEKIVEKVIEKVVYKEPPKPKPVVVKPKPQPPPPPKPKPIEAPKIPVIPVKERFEDLEAMIRLVVKGVRPSFFISGKSGAAKSYTVLNVLEQMGLVEGKDWFLCKGTTSPVGIYSTLFKWNKKGSVVVFDDSDDAFSDKTSMNLLKSALDTTDVRRVSWIVNTNYDPTVKTKEEQDKLIDAGKLPKFFDYVGTIIFISNIPFEDVAPAIKTRCLVQDLQLTQDEMFEEMERRLPSISPDMDMSKKREVFEILKRDYKNGNKEISFRTLVTALALVSSGIEKWQEIVTRYG